MWGRAVRPRPRHVDGRLGSSTGADMAISVCCCGGFDLDEKFRNGERGNAHDRPRRVRPPEEG